MMAIVWIMAALAFFVGFLAGNVYAHLTDR